MTVNEAIQNALDFIAAKHGHEGGDVYQNLKRAQLTPSLRELSERLRRQCPRCGSELEPTGDDYFCHQCGWMGSFTVAQEAKCHK
jgi:tRNA(Ile2) C34 agmatinyltransferase TiaS